MFVRVISSILTAAILAAAPAATLAQTAPVEVTAPSAAMTELLDGLGLSRLMPILRTEGIDYASSLEGEMFPGRGNARWSAALEQIYDADRMTDVMANELAARLPETAVTPLAAFFGSDQGRRIIELEIGAREAMLDDSVDEGSRARLQQLREDEDPRLDMLDTFVEVNDLVEMNVAGALNSNLAFYKGLMEQDAFNGALSESEMLNDVWSQEADIRSETTEWVYAYLSMAYRPLPDEDLQAYIDMSERPEGAALNTALFGAFDALFTQISLELGRTVALMMVGEDI